MKELTECCVLMIKLLDKLLAAGKITQEEYEEHVRLKKEYLKKIKPPG